MARKIFVSYSSKQSEFAQKIKSDLEKQDFEVSIDKIVLRHAVLSFGRKI
jgi:hypothetical protein